MKRQQKINRKKRVWLHVPRNPKPEEKWRATVRDKIREGLETERLVTRHPLAKLIRKLCKDNEWNEYFTYSSYSDYGWMKPMLFLKVVVSEKTLDEFTAIVETVSEALDAGPDDTDGKVSQDNDMINLSAQWKFMSGQPNVTVTVFNGDAKGCMIDPRKPPTPSVYSSGKEGEIHPDCREILKSL